jgi:hypothetical protein
MPRPAFVASVDDREKAVEICERSHEDVSASDESIGQLRNYFDDSQIAELTMVQVYLMF